MTDVLLYQTNDGGEINVVNGVVEMSGGLETMLYLCMFGGNFDDDGSQNSPNNWWGNVDEPDPAEHYRSKTQNLLRSIPLTTSNLLRIKDAVKSDISTIPADEVQVSVSIPGLDQVLIEIEVTADGSKQNFTYLENWRVEL